MEVAAKTWTGDAGKTGGGGTAWDPIVYDPELDLVYFGTGNGTAWYRDLRGGDRENEENENITVHRIVEAGEGDEG
jgi:glucose dehydrogenase